jgi:phenylpyruvate tautomerase PptA (4-oxalocrotonate tautomerase family)
LHGYVESSSPTQIDQEVAAMPMLDAFIPQGALDEAAEHALLSELTDLLLFHEGVDPTNETARQIAWVFVHRTEMYVAGAPADAPRYRFIAQVPEGQYDDERRAAVTKAMTEAVVKAEGGRHADPEARVWVFTNEIPDGTWGGRGVIFRLPDIAELVVGPEGRRQAEARLSNRTRQTAQRLLDAVKDPAAV